MSADNLHFHKHRVSRELKETRNNHKSRVIWFTGLSGSGKSTVANATEKLLHDRGLQTYILDGDNVRMGLNKDLGFSPQDRTENIRRITEVAKLFADSGSIILQHSFHHTEKIEIVQDKSSVMKILLKFLLVQIYLFVNLGILKDYIKKQEPVKLKVLQVLMLLMKNLLIQNLLLKQINMTY